MEIRCCRKDARLDGQKRLSSLMGTWGGLFLYMFLIWAFIFIIAPWIQELPSVKPLAEFIEESGIDASALYYTEVEEASEAELHMRSTINFLPQGP
jgi:hypothetical protein